MPGELSLQVAAGCEGLAGFDDLERVKFGRMRWRNIAYVEVLGIDFIMLGKVEVLLCDEHALYRDLLVKVRVGDP